VTTLTDLVNESLKRNLLHNIVLRNSEVVFLIENLGRLGTASAKEAALLKGIVDKLNVSRYDK